MLGEMDGSSPSLTETDLLLHILNMFSLLFSPESNFRQRIKK